MKQLQSEAGYLPEERPSWIRLILCFILITGRKIPLYYGSSFAYLTAIASMCAAEGFAKVDGILPTEAIQYAQFGIILSGFVSIAAGLLVRFFGRKAVETILPASITGPVAMIIGLTLALSLIHI